MGGWVDRGSGDQEIEGLREVGSGDLGIGGWGGGSCLANIFS